MARFLSASITDWDQLIGDYDQPLFVVEKILWPNLTKKIKVEPTDSLLDLGCGVGKYTGFFSKKVMRCAGVDISPNSIKLAQKNFRHIDFYCQDALHFSDGNQYSIILANMLVCNLASLDQVRQFFINCRGLLSENGILFVTNVHSRHQKSCDLDWLIHDYPPNPQEGSQIKVNLKKINGTYLSFSNYHWTNEKLVEVANSFGLACSSFVDLNPEITSTPVVYPKYNLMSFRRNNEF